MSVPHLPPSPRGVKHLPPFWYEQTARRRPGDRSPAIALDPVIRAQKATTCHDSTGARWFVAATDDGRVRQQIRSQQAFVCDLARGGDTLALSDTELAKIPIDGDRADGDCILRAPEGDAHVVHTNGLRQWIPDGATWSCEIDRGLEVINTTRQYIDAIPEGGWRVCTT